jgi:alkanesulfonate monooxygenase SsuD/methylene tetrahydromethanopterin reductase-like flavin-dependent oxidoreductase (luciferase family)
VVQRVRRHCQQHPQLLTARFSGQGLFMLLHGLARFNAWQPEGFKQQLLAAATARLQQGLQPSSSSSRGNQEQAFQAQQLPVVLLSLTQLQITLPTPLLQHCETLLLPQLQELSLQQLTVCLFAMGGARHNPSAAFLDAAMAHVDAGLQQQGGPQDVAQLLYGLAAMGGVREQLMLQPQQQERVARLLARLQQVGLLRL